MSSSAEIIDPHEPEPESPPESVESYLEGLPDIYYHNFRLLRLELVLSLNAFVGDAMGTTLEKYAVRLQAEFDTSGDLFFLNLFRTLGLKSNPVALEHVLGRERWVPTISVATTEGRSGSRAIPAWFNPFDNTISLDGEGVNSYRRFRRMFFHEMIHALIGSHSHNRRDPEDNRLLDEMFTQLFDFRTFAFSVDREPRELAEALYDLDREMVVNWYCRGHWYYHGSPGDEFKEQLATNLTRTYSEETARKIADEVWRLPEMMLRLRKRARLRYGLIEFPEPTSAFYEFVQRDFQERAYGLIRALATKIRAAQRATKRSLDVSVKEDRQP